MSRGPGSNLRRAGTWVANHDGERYRWTDDAACRGLIPECDRPDCRHVDGFCPWVVGMRDVDRMFYPSDPGATARDAIEVCQRCPVWRECLEDAKESQDAWDHGVRGGLSDRERRQLGLDAALALAQAKHALGFQEELIA